LNWYFKLKMLRRFLSEGSLDKNEPSSEEHKAEKKPEGIISPLVINGFSFYFMSKFFYESL